METPSNDVPSYNGTMPISEHEREELKKELQKTEEEIQTLRQVLNARVKHAQELKKKLGVSPLAEVTSEINDSLRQVKDSQAYQKTAEVAAATAETVATKWNEMKNSSLFKSFESKLGSAYNNAKIVASTSIDHLSGIRSSHNSAAPTPQTEGPPSRLS
ncbi:Tumour protein D52 family-containing protein [Strongyloides ratti]|uniref:Tumour protein D52 family-containing protein n=1 Tax=Strongyloides ratti TaxID=34506 RepID=A0A090LHR5_STRRB|nr:Tumour protein D52 family-containing protein [Strongyloides ratti]CEF69351.1 Tumour protein D52 family-containing protein [Strongyloides ratti]